MIRLRDWPVEAQHQARRNAMIATTACAQRRAEREDVDDFLQKRYAPAAPAADEIHQPSRPARAR